MTMPNAFPLGRLGICHFAVGQSVKKPTPLNPAQPPPLLTFVAALDLSGPPANGKGI
jgi:hypothetical protein